MIIVALVPAAKSTTAAETSSPTTEWKVPPTEATSCLRPVEPALVGAAQAVGRDHVHGQQLGAGRALGQPGATPDQRLALRAAGDGDHDALLGRPGLLDPVRAPVVVELVVDPVGQPEQRQLAERGQVADPEVRRERGVDLVGLVDVAVRHPPAQRLGDMSTSWIWSAVRTTSSGTVSRCRTPVIRSTSSLSDSRCWMLMVVMTSMPAASSSSTSWARFSCRLPGTLVCASSSTKADRRLPGQHRVDVHLRERRAAVGRPSCAARSRAPRAGPRSARGRGSRRSRRPRRCRGPAAAGPRRARRRSCPPPARSRGRRSGARSRSARSTAPIVASGRPPQPRGRRC